MKPLAIDLYCGLGGWAEGFLAEGYRVVGFDIERHDYGTGGYPGQLVLQDVRTLHGSQFKDAAVIVASPPCQAYSYRAMPWSRAKALPPPDNSLFEACFRIQKEANEAICHCACWRCSAGGHCVRCDCFYNTRQYPRYIPLIVENVRGAQKWVGRAKWHFGSYFLWGDVPALMPRAFGRKSQHEPLVQVPKGTGRTSWFFGNSKHEGRYYGVKQHGSGREWFAGEGRIGRETSSKSLARKIASAQIAKIPFPLAQHIARCFKPTEILEHALAGDERREEGAQ